MRCSIDSELNFENLLSAIFNKVSIKVNDLGQITNYMSLEKRSIVMKTFIESQFSYCPLIWMFHSWTINNKTNRLLERALRIVYSDFKSSFAGLLMKDNCFFNIWKKRSKFSYGTFEWTVPPFSKLYFHKNISNSYDIRNHKEFYSRNPKTDRYKTETVSYMAPKT